MFRQLSKIWFFLLLLTALFSFLGEGRYLTVLHRPDNALIENLTKELTHVSKFKSFKVTKKELFLRDFPHYEIRAAFIGDDQSCDVTFTLSLRGKYWVTDDADIRCYGVEEI